MSYRHLASCAALTFSLLTTGIADTLTLKDVLDRVAKILR